MKLMRRIASPPSPYGNDTFRALVPTPNGPIGIAMTGPPQWIWFAGGFATAAAIAVAVWPRNRRRAAD